MGRMVRKQIYIEAEQEALLKRLGEQTGLSEAEIVRRAIDQQAKVPLAPSRDLSAWREERAFVQRLIQEGAVPGGRTWRREDLHE